MLIKNGKTNGTNDSIVAIPSHNEIDLKIATARRAQSQAILRMVTGSISAIDKRLLHRA